MRNIFKALFITIITLLSSCQQSDNSSNGGNEATFRIKAGFDPTTKVAIEQTNVKWVKGDFIFIAEIDHNNRYKYIRRFYIDEQTISEDGRSAEFTGNNLEIGARYIAVTGENATIDPSGKLKIESSVATQDESESTDHISNMWLMSSKPFVASSREITNVHFTNHLSIVSLNIKMDKSVEDEYKLGSIKFGSTSNSFSSSWLIDGDGVITPLSNDNLLSFATINIKDEPTISSRKSYVANIPIWWNPSESNAPEKLTITIKTTQGEESQVEIEGKVLKANTLYTKDIEFQKPTTTDKYVDIDWEESTIVNYDKNSGIIDMTLPDDQRESITTGTTIILPQEYNHEIRVIRSFSSSATGTTLNTTPGNMCNLFKDTEFTLATNPSQAQTMTRSGNSNVIAPTKITLVSKDGDREVVYDKKLATRSDYIIAGYSVMMHNDFSDKTIIEKGGFRAFYKKGVFDSGINGLLFFKFGSEVDGFFDFIGKIQQFSAVVEGGFKTDILAAYEFDYSYNADFGFNEPYYLKRNVLKDIEFEFEIAKIPVYITVSTHLCSLGSIVANGQASLTTGFKSSGNLRLGFNYYPEQDLATPIFGGGFDFDPYPVEFEAETSVTGTMSVYPKFDFDIYGIGGPSIEPISYLEDRFVCGFAASSDNGGYLGWVNNLYSGMKYRNGLDLRIWGLVDEHYDSKVGELNYFHTLISTAPKKIEIVSIENGNQSMVDITKQPVKVTYRVSSYNHITNKYSPCSNVVVQVSCPVSANRVTTPYIITDSNGEATATWNVTCNDGYLLAEILNASGNRIEYIVYSPIIITDPSHRF